MTSHQLESLRQRLSKFYPEEWEQNMWLNIPNMYLDGRTASECNYGDVCAALDHMDKAKGT